MVLNKDFKEFIALLNEHKVQYIIVGGYALAFHGYPRFTKDIDLWIWAILKNWKVDQEKQTAYEIVSK